MEPQLIAALKSRLEADLPDVIEPPLPQIGQVFDFIPPPGLLTVFPAVGVGDAPARMEDDIGSSATVVYGLYVVVYVQSADQGTLARQLREYAQAIRRVTLRDRQLPPAWGLVCQQIDPGPTLVDNADAPQEWMSWTGLRFTARVDEDW